MIRVRDAQTANPSGPRPRSRKGRPVVAEDGPLLAIDRGNRSARPGHGPLLGRPGGESVEEVSTIALPVSPADRVEPPDRRARSIASASTVIRPAWESRAGGQGEPGRSPSRRRPSTRPSAARSPSTDGRAPGSPARGPSARGPARGSTPRARPARSPGRGAPIREGRSRACEGRASGRSLRVESTTISAVPSRTRYTEKYHSRPDRTSRTSQTIAR